MKQRVDRPVREHPIRQGDQRDVLLSRIFRRLFDRCAGKRDKTIRVTIVEVQRDGMAKALLDKNPSPSEDEIREAIHPNLCRCTGYVKIVNAVQLAAKRMKEGAQ